MTDGSFPTGFVWGTATAAYQIEGAVREDGRGPSIWDTFSHTPGKIADGSTGDVACDHYHRWREDVALMRELGVGGYRLSLAWPRVLPEGTGKLNQRGLDFYERLIDGLLAANITPFVTLYHWDLPQRLQDWGGWPVRDTAEAFAEYADKVVRRLGDRVQNWITLNEPWCSSILGYAVGEHAPGVRQIPQALAAAHYLLVGHGLAVQAIRASGHAVQVGITLNLTPAVPASDRAEDEQAAQIFDGFFNRWFLDPLHGKGYPADMQAVYGPAVPEFHPDDLKIIATPTDFLGINYYSVSTVRYAPNEPLGFAGRSPEEGRAAGNEITEMGWEVVPEGLRDLLVRVHREYAPSTIYITENGAAFPDTLTAEGRVHDDRRTAYLHNHFAATAAAMAAGVPVRGYFVWSLLDNFEWAHGYTKRFGLAYVDYATQKRVLKDSARWYQHVIANNTNLDPKRVES